MATFVVGLIIGGVAGVFFAALCIAIGNADEEHHDEK